jgi:hypothetical protein
VLRKVASLCSKEPVTSLQACQLKRRVKDAREKILKVDDRMRKEGWRVFKALIEHQANFKQTSRPTHAGIFVCHALTCLGPYFAAIIRDI